MIYLSIYILCKNKLQFQILLFLNLGKLYEYISFTMLYVLFIFIFSEYMMTFWFKSNDPNTYKYFQ